MNISRQDVDNYFKSRPLKKLYLTKLGLFDEYYRNCLYNAGNCLVLLFGRKLVSLSFGTK